MKIVAVGPSSLRLVQAFKTRASGVDVQMFVLEAPSDVDDWLNSLAFPATEQYLIFIEVSVLGGLDEALQRLRTLDRTIPHEGKQLGTQVYVVYGPEEAQIAAQVAGEAALSLSGLLADPKLQLGLL